MSYRKRCGKVGHVWVARPNASALLWVHCERLGCTAVRVAHWVPVYMYDQVFSSLSEKDRCDPEE